jgi:hypothetical protein
LYANEPWVAISITDYTIRIRRCRLGMKGDACRDVSPEHAVVVTVPVVLLVLLFQRRIVAGLTAGAVKG